MWVARITGAACSPAGKAFVFRPSYPSGVPASAICLPGRHIPPHLRSASPAGKAFSW